MLEGLLRSLGYEKITITYTATTCPTDAEAPARPAVGRALPHTP